MLLDEPMTGLDPVGRVEVKAIIDGSRERGKTVVFNTHILADVGELCSRIGDPLPGASALGRLGRRCRGRRRQMVIEGFFMEVVRA